MARQGLALAGGVIGAYFGGPVGAQVGFAIGSAVGGYIDPEVIQGPKLGEIPMQTGRDGVPIPVGWGVCHTAGNIIQKNAIQEVEKEESSGGKGGGPIVVNTFYYRTFAIGVMRSIDGPIASILRIWENDKLVYDTRETPEIPATDTAAYAEGLRIYFGDDGQDPDPDLEAQWGVGTTPSYRGLPYVVFVDKDLTEFAGAIPQYRFEIQTTADLTVTSRPYSLELSEGFEHTFAIAKFRPYDATKEGYTATFSITSIGIEGLRENYTMAVEGYDATFSLDDITIDTVRKDYEMTEEGYTATFSIGDITLTPKRVTYTMEVEGFDATFAVNSITLS